LSGRANRHWQEFAADVTWFAWGRKKRIAVGPPAEPGSWKASRAFAALFPRLAALLEAAHTSSVSVDDERYVLFSWESAGGVRSWLARPPGAAPGDLFPAHRTLLAEFGGVTERAGEFEKQWLLNTNESLTLSEASNDAGFIRDYDWAFEDVPGGIPIELAAYYVISREVTGNATLCHRRDGDVLLFAPDHAFRHVVPLAGCPDYTLYRIKGAPGFVDWVEAVAKQWTAKCVRGRRAGK
jgi:hypothetical protein